MRTSSAAYGPPTGLAVRAGPTGPVLSWDAPNSTSYGTLTDYAIHRAASASGPFARIATTGLDPTYRDTSAPDGLNHYRVTAVHLGQDEGAPSNVAAVLIACPAALGSCLGV